MIHSKNNEAEDERLRVDISNYRKGQKMVDAGLFTEEELNMPDLKESIRKRYFERNLDVNDGIH